MIDFSDVPRDVIEVHYRQISENVKKIRIKKGYTQEQIALSMGFTTATFYTNAENFKRNKHFNLEHLIKISYILDVDILEFFKKEESKE